MKKFAYLILLLLIICNGSIFAQPERDSSFSITGSYSIGASFIPQDAVVQSDNKPVALSSCRTINAETYQFCFVRLNEDGMLDTSFTDSRPFTVVGTSKYSVPGSGVETSSGGSGLALQADGKIIAVGSVNNGGLNVAVMMRLNANGALDSTFGTNGIRSYPTGNFFSKVAVQPDGKIVVVGSGGAHQLATRILPDGTPDNTFGDNGFKYLINPSGTSRGYSIALQADGKIVTGGILTISTTNFYLLTRLNKDGSLDTSFDDDGYKSIPVSGAGTDAFISIAVKANGQITALGNKNILYQLNSNGSLDTGFDNDGSRSALNGTSTSNRLLVSASGKIMVVGFPTLMFGNEPYNYRIARYLSNGSPDAGFSGDGLLDVDVTGFPYDGADVVAFDNQGRIFIGGRYWDGLGPVNWQNSSYSAIRLLASPAQNVGFSGRVTNDEGRAVANAYLTLKNGSEIIGYARTNPFGYFRFTNVPSNVTYTLSTVSKNLNFYDRSVLVDGAIENFLVVGE